MVRPLANSLLCLGDMDDSNSQTFASGCFFRTRRLSKPLAFCEFASVNFEPWNFAEFVTSRVRRNSCASFNIVLALEVKRGLRGNLNPKILNQRRDSIKGTAGFALLTEKAKNTSIHRLRKRL